jgi:hypothetical protein
MAILVRLPITPAVAARLSVAALMLRLRGVEQWVFVIRKYLICGLKDVFEGEGPLATHTRELGNEARQ